MYIKTLGMDRIEIRMRHASELFGPTSVHAFVYNDDGRIVAAIHKRKTASFELRVWPPTASVAQGSARILHQSWTDPIPIPQAFESDLETFITATLVKERLTS